MYLFKQYVALRKMMIALAEAYGTPYGMMVNMDLFQPGETDDA